MSTRLGLRENLGQFSLLVLVNAFVGAMLGLERSILPLLAEQDFQLAARTAILSFIVVFGVSKAFTNYLAGRLSDHYGRRKILILGWIIALPVPFLLMWAPSWEWILIANAFLGVSQGLTWSVTVIMKIDLVGPKQRGLAMGLNEFSGYFAVAGSALTTGWLASSYGLRPEPFYLGVVYGLVGLSLSVIFVRDTSAHVQHESSLQIGDMVDKSSPSQGAIFRRVSFKDRTLSSVSQAGFVNNLNDGMAWGMFPLLYAAKDLTLTQIGQLVAIYPAVWGMTQVFTGALSDRVGRKRLIVYGMWLQAAGIGLTAIGAAFTTFMVAAGILGLGTAMVYPTLLAAIGDVTPIRWRASAVGIYRLWRDLGYAAGALLAGLIADRMGASAAVFATAALTFLSGVLVLQRMQETLPRNPV